MTSTERLPLFPLRSVLFPGGLLPLKVFEARYLDLISRCLREQEFFGVVCLKEGIEAGKHAVAFESAGTVAHVRDVDALGANLLRVNCIGGARFEFTRAATQDEDGLWRAAVQLLPDDNVVAPETEMGDAVQALRLLAAQLDQQGQHPFAPPYAFDNAAWVSNRWCEILPLPLPAKQRLLLMPDPLVRLRLVREFLKSRALI
jgi:uncharacterized protein